MTGVEHCAPNALVVPVASNAQKTTLVANTAIGSVNCTKSRHRSCIYLILSQCSLTALPYRSLGQGFQDLEHAQEEKRKLVATLRDLIENADFTSERVSNALSLLEEVSVAEKRTLTTLTNT